MKRIALVCLALITSSCFSQTRNIKVNVNQKVLVESFWMSLNSQVEKLDDCSIALADSSKKVVKTETFPKPKPFRGMKQYTELSIPFKELPSASYTYTLYLGKELMHLVVRGRILIMTG